MKKVAIQNDSGDFGRRWADYCRRTGIPFKIVDCYQSNIVEQLSDCQVLLWQVHQNNPVDRLMAKQLLFSLENSSLRVFPNPRTVWHFDDKVGQKYLLEAIDAPLVKSWVFYSRKSAMEWLKSCSYPKVFKLRGGAGSMNVRLVRNRRQGQQLVRRAFGRGFSPYNGWRSVLERWRHFRQGSKGVDAVLMGLWRLLVPPPYARGGTREKGYVYFQEFIPNNQHDIRVTCVYNRCFATRRSVRKGDFRASGSGVSDLDQTKIPREALRIALDVSKRLGLQTAAFDFVLNDGRPQIVELSYVFGYPKEIFDLGFYDADLNFHSGHFNPFDWMVEGTLSEAHLNEAPR